MNFQEQLRQQAKDLKKSPYEVVDKKQEEEDKRTAKEIEVAIGVRYWYEEDQWWLRNYGCSSNWTEQYIEAIKEGREQNF